LLQVAHCRVLLQLGITGARLFEYVINFSGYLRKQMIGPRFGACLLLLTVLGGCAGSASLPEGATSNSEQVSRIMAHEAAGMGTARIIEIDGKPAGDPAPRALFQQYAYYELPPGQHAVQILASSSEPMVVQNVAGPAHLAGFSTSRAAAKINFLAEPGHTYQVWTIRQQYQLKDATTGVILQQGRLAPIAQ
jgi:hypothetical protein